MRLFMQPYADRREALGARRCCEEEREKQSNANLHKPGIPEIPRYRGDILPRVRPSGQSIVVEFRALQDYPLLDDAIYIGVPRQGPDADRRVVKIFHSSRRWRLSTE